MKRKSSILHMCEKKKRRKKAILNGSLHACKGTPHRHPFAWMHEDIAQVPKRRTAGCMLYHNLSSHLLALALGVDARCVEVLSASRQKLVHHLGRMTT
jgi:hypothetical protein